LLFRWVLAQLELSRWAPAQLATRFCEEASMKKIGVAFLAAAAVSFMPLLAFGQDDEPAADEPGTDEPAAEGAETPEKPEKGEADDAGLGGICEIDPDACPKLDFDKEAARDIREQVFAVQQLFVLRRWRLEVQPYWQVPLNDQFVGHSGPGMAINFWITNVLAAGISGNYYEPFNSDSEFNFQVRRSARVSVPLTEYQWNANVNFTYTPIVGKFSGFGDFIFQYDAYVVGGVGAISVRPIPVIDPDNRGFNWQTNIAFNAGLGLHIFFNRWLAATLEVRDYVFNDKLENTEIVEGDEQNPDTWYGETQLTNNVQAQFGIALFFPFSFEYRLPK
jgi:outer membrane beta-barrel protein